MSTADEKALADMPGRPASSLTVNVPNPEPLVAQFTPLERKVAALTITDEASHKEGLELGKRIAGMKKLVKEMYAEPKKSAFDHHRLITATEAKYLIPLEKTGNLLGSKLLTYEQAEKARADAEARQRQAEANRIEQERALSEAIAAESAGDKELVDAILEAPPEAPVVIATPNLAEVAGASQRTTWSARVDNLLALVKYVAANPDSINLVQANETALNGLARALKENMRVPGVRSIPTIVRTFKDVE
jgi:hypothetical protein